MRRGASPLPRPAVSPTAPRLTAYRLAARHGEPAARHALSGAVELIAGLIEQRGRRRDLDVQRDRPHDEG